MNAAQAAAVNTFKYAAGTYGAGGDYIDWSYYDTMCVPGAAGVVRYFVTPVGQANNHSTTGVAKTLADTNTTVGGMIPKAQNFTVKALKLFYTSHAALATASVQVLYTILKTTTVEFIISGKFVYGQWTLAELLGAATLIAVTPTAAGDNLPFISPRFHGIFPLNSWIILSENTNYELRVTYNTAGGALTDDLLMISMNGRLAYAT